MTTRIYRLSDSIEDDRPEVDFELPINGEDIDWLAVGEVLDGDLDTAKWPEISLVVHHPDAIVWDHYSAAGTLGIWSQRAIRAVGQESLRNFHLLPCTLNGESYWFLRCESRVKCFDKTRSRWEPIPGKADRIMKVYEYAFYSDRIQDSLLFCVPELQNQLFATQSIVDSLRRTNCKGIEMKKIF